MLYRYCYWYFMFPLTRLSNLYFLTYKRRGVGGFFLLLLILYVIGQCTRICRSFAVGWLCRAGVFARGPSSGSCPGCGFSVRLNRSAFQFFRNLLFFICLNDCVRFTFDQILFDTSLF